MQIEFFKILGAVSLVNIISSLLSLEENSRYFTKSA